MDLKVIVGLKAKGELESWSERWVFLFGWSEHKVTGKWIQFVVQVLYGQSLTCVSF